eukprot:366166-Chlamydomonas_euryale.AAC.9
MGTATGSAGPACSRERRLSEGSSGGAVALAVAFNVALTRQSDSTSRTSPVVRLASSISVTDMLHGSSMPSIICMGGGGGGMPSGGGGGGASSGGGGGGASSGGGSSCDRERLAPKPGGSGGGGSSMGSIPGPAGIPPGPAGIVMFMAGGGSIPGPVGVVFVGPVGVGRAATPEPSPPSRSRQSMIVMLTSESLSPRAIML